LLFHLLQNLLLVEGLAVQVDIAAVQPLAVQEPATGDV